MACNMDTKLCRTTQSHLLGTKLAAYKLREVLIRDGQRQVWLHIGWRRTLCHAGRAVWSQVQRPLTAVNFEEHDALRWQFRHKLLTGTDLFGAGSAYSGAACMSMGCADRAYLDLFGKVFSFDGEGLAELIEEGWSLFRRHIIRLYMRKQYRKTGSKKGIRRLAMANLH